MSQDNPQISTTPPLPGLQLVQDLNKALQTLATDFSGATDPAAMAWPYSTWADTGTGTLKRRNAANSAWMIERNLFEDLRLTASATDTTAGRVLKVGDFGWGADISNTTRLPGGTNLNTVTANGTYGILSPKVSEGAPMDSGDAGLLVFGDYHSKVQIFNAVVDRLFWRMNNTNDTISWSPWVELYHSGNLTQATETAAGLLEIATTAEAQALTNDLDALTPKKLADAFKGPNISTASPYFQRLPSGMMVQGGEISITPPANSYAAGSFVFPVAFLNVPSVTYGISTSSTTNAYTCHISARSNGNVSIRLYNNSASSGVSVPVTIIAFGY